MIPSFPGEECTCEIKLHCSVNFHMHVDQRSLIMTSFLVQQTSLLNTCRYSYFVKGCPTEALKVYMVMQKCTKGGPGFPLFDQSSSCLSTKKKETINTGIAVLSDLILTQIFLFNWYIVYIVYAFMGKSFSKTCIQSKSANTNRIDTSTSSSSSSFISE